MTDQEVAAVVEAELEAVPELSARSRIEQFLTRPNSMRLQWEYAPNEWRHCWSVGKSADLSTQVVFCPEGFGTDRWGVLSLDADSMGNDGQWFLRLLDAAVASGWTPAPSGYEVP